MRRFVVGRFSVAGRFWARGAVFAGLFLAACISSAPPAPAVRYFDPLPTTAPAATRTVSEGVAGPVYRVTAAPHLGREFAVRTGPRELVFDPLHSWIAPPRELVEAALLARRGPIGPELGTAELRVTAFEIDLVEAPRARVHLVQLAPGQARRDVEATAPVVGSGPEDFAQAMAAALASAVADVLTQR